MTCFTTTTRRRFLVALTSAGLARGLTSTAAATDVADRLQTVEPPPIDDVLVNPGVGLETFHTFNADPASPANRGPRRVANYPQCSIAYFRLTWKELEPDEGRYNLGRVASLLEQARSHGQELALRFMPWFATLEAQYVPEWFKRKAQRHFRCRFNVWAGPHKGLTKDDFWAPDFNDPYYLDRQESLVAAFGERFNGHPNLCRMDIGSVGNWGEWHTSNTVPQVPMVTEPNARRMIDAYFRSFGRSPLVFNLHHSVPPGLQHAIGKGAGWRTDGNDIKHVWERVDPVLAAPLVGRAWQHGPVTGEPVLREIKNPEATFAKALSWHASSINAFSHPLPAATVAPLERFLKRCGYRLVLRRVQFPSRAAAGQPLPLRVEVENTGVAPPYRDYVLAVRLRSANREVVVETDARPRAWLPGLHAVELRPRLPAGLPGGDYELAVALVAPHDRQPAVRLAIAGRTADGWYPLGRLMITTA